MANISSAPYPKLTSLIANAAKQTQDWWRLNGVAIATCDSYLYVGGNTFYLIDSARFYFLGFGYIINNNGAYGSVVQPAITKKNTACQVDLIVGRRDWLEINREKLAIPPGMDLVMI